MVHGTNHRPGELTQLRVSNTRRDFNPFFHHEELNRPHAWRLTSKMHLGEADLLDFEEMGAVFGKATYEIVWFALAQLESRSASIFLAASRNTFR
jgi:hypothetical protein